MTKQIEKILIIEDQQKYRDAASQCFSSRKDVSVDFAVDYDEAMQKLGKGKYSGILTDCFFPKKTGSGDKSAGTKALLEMMADTAEKAAEHLWEGEGPELVKTYQTMAEQWRSWDFPDLPKSISLLIDTTDPLSHFKGYKGLYDVIKSGPEDQQPLGTLIVREAEKKGIPCLIVTSTYHHDKLTQPISSLLYDKMLDVDYWSKKDEKATPEFWEKAYQKLKEKEEK
jgi:CheY-like chemotaxis protein